VNDRSIPALPHAKQHPPHLAVAELQSPRRFDLRQMLLFDLMQHLQSIPFSLAQRYALRFHRPLGHP
jgi:hypothetical protein